MAAAGTWKSTRGRSPAHSAACPSFSEICFIVCSCAAHRRRTCQSFVIQGSSALCWRAACKQAEGAQGCQCPPAAAEASLGQHPHNPTKTLPLAHHSRGQVAHGAPDALQLQPHPLAALPTTHCLPSKPGTLASQQNPPHLPTGGARGCRRPPAAAESSRRPAASSAPPRRRPPPRPPRPE